VLILIDGFRFGPSNLLLVSRYYESLGFEVERMPFNIDDLLNLELYAIHIAARFAEVTKKCGDRKIYMLAFSMGGIAMLDALQRDGIADRVRCAVSYGTPYRGSPLATLGAPFGNLWQLLKQLRILSPYLRRLTKKPLPEGLAVISIAGAGDLICPAPLCRLAGATNITIAGGHASFMYRTDLHDRIAKLLLSH
jgi:hypothetical protein